ncbi:MAG TPA: hypothetical protein PL131_04355 [Methylotenera sp.]|nr:hypothetical protein [Methylotenera sp.]HPH05085.1 hypothetical protein [Methylotenera sp.]HPN00449.1 hypothetical protein [Methylotenera sp.]
MKNLIKNHRYQSFIFTVISLTLLAYLLRDFGTKDTLFKQVASIAFTGILGLAILGAWLRKTWVQYCFFAIAIYGLITSVITLLLVSARMYYAYENASLAIMIFNAQYIFTLIYFVLAYLARYFFDEKPPQTNGFTQFLLASGLASCVLAFSVWSVILARKLLPSNFNEQMNMTIMLKLQAWQIADKWWIMIMSLPHLLCHTLLVAFSVWVLSKWTRVWSRQLVYIGSLFLFGSLLLAHGMQHFSAYIKGKEVSSLIGEYGFITDQLIIIVSFFIAGLLTTTRKQSAIKHAENT